jgi:hypothetical protein
MNAVLKPAIPEAYTRLGKAALHKACARWC